MKKAPLPFDPFALAQAAGKAAIGLAARPAELLSVQLEAARQWSDFWSDALAGKSVARSRATAASRRRNGRTTPITARSATPICSLRQQLRDVVDCTAGEGSNGAMARFLLDQYLNAIAPTNFAMTNPEVVKRTFRRPAAPISSKAFANLLEDVGSGKGHRAAPHRSNRVRKGQDDRRDAGLRWCSRTICSS